MIVPDRRSKSTPIFTNSPRLQMRAGWWDKGAVEYRFADELNGWAGAWWSTVYLAWIDWRRMLTRG